jgi:hypothetical protein
MEAILPLLCNRSSQSLGPVATNHSAKGLALLFHATPMEARYDDDLDHQPRVAYRVAQPAAAIVRASIL